MTVDTQKLRELLETLDESPWNEREIVASVPALLAENDALREFASAYVLWVVTGAKPERTDGLFGMAKAALNPPAPPQGETA